MGVTPVAAGLVAPPVDPASAALRKVEHPAALRPELPHSADPLDAEAYPSGAVLALPAEVVPVLDQVEPADLDYPRFDSVLPRQVPVVESRQSVWELAEPRLQVTIPRVSRLHRATHPSDCRVDLKENFAGKPFLYLPLVVPSPFQGSL